MIILPSAVGLAANQLSPPSDNTDLLTAGELLAAELIVLRREFHAHPELAYGEFKTSERCAEYLTQCGYKVTRGLAGTGLIADLGPGPVNSKMIAIRADMDALPIGEHNNVAYRSQTAGIMHACGHDAHMASALGAAKILSTRVRQGRVRIIMQPAEEAERLEVAKGSISMIEAGALKQVSAVLGFHVDSTLPLGQVAILQEAASSFTTPFELSIKTSPVSDKEMAVLQLTSAVMQQLYKAQNEFAVAGAQLCLQSVEADAPSNAGTIRGMMDYTSLQSVQDVKRTIQTLCNAMAPSDLFKLSLDPSAVMVDSHQMVIDKVYAIACETLGTAKVNLTRRKTWTAHFADYTKHVPGAFFTLGTQISRSLRTMHSAGFDIDERVLPIGAALLAQAALGLLEDDVKFGH